MPLVQEAPARLDDEAVARRDLASAIVAHFDAHGLNNTQAAVAAGIPRQEVIRLRRGETDRYSLGWLMKAHATIAPDVRVRLVIENMETRK